MKFLFEIAIGILTTIFCGLAVFLFKKFKKKKLETANRESLFYKTFAEEEKSDTFLFMGIYPLPYYMKGRSAVEKPPVKGQRF